MRRRKPKNKSKKKKEKIGEKGEKIERRYRQEKEVAGGIREGRGRRKSRG